MQMVAIDGSGAPGARELPAPVPGPGELLEGRAIKVVIRRATA